MYHVKIITYEWVVEVTTNVGVITDACSFKTLYDARQWLIPMRERGERLSVHLTRARDAPGYTERVLAYVDRGKLPDRFAGGGTIPARFRDELAAALKAGIVKRRE